MAIQFSNITLILEKYNYSTKTANAYMVFDLDFWPRKLLDDFTLKNCSFVATNIPSKKQ